MTSKEGAVYTSKELYFLSNIPAPTINLDDKSLETGVTTKMLDEKAGLKLSGSVTSESPATVKYRIISAKAFISDGIARAAPAGYAPEVPSFATAPEVKLNRRGQFTIDLKYADIPEGISVVEIEATNNSGKRSTSAAIIENFPERRTLVKLYRRLPLLPFIGFRVVRKALTYTASVYIREKL